MHSCPAGFNPSRMRRKQSFFLQEKLNETETISKQQTNQIEYELWKQNQRKIQIKMLNQVSEKDLYIFVILLVKPVSRFAILLFRLNKLSISEKKKCGTHKCKQKT